MDHSYVLLRAGRGGAKRSRTHAFDALPLPTESRAEPAAPPPPYLRGIRPGGCGLVGVEDVLTSVRRLPLYVRAAMRSWGWRHMRGPQIGLALARSTRVGVDRGNV